MPYCPRCGVEVEERLEKCPLCTTPIPDEVREHPDMPGDFPEDIIDPKPLYRKLSEGQKRFLALSFIALLGVFPIAITMGIDLFQNGTVTWSYYVMIPLLGVAAIAWIFVHYLRKPLISLSALMVVVLAIEMLISNRYSPGNFMSAPELPFFLLSFGVIELFLLYIMKRRRGVLQILSFLFLDAALLVGGIDYIITRSLTWSPVVFSSLIPAALYLSYIRIVKKKGLNLMGFFFIDLALMLTALDWTTSGTISWSLITSLIFLSIAAISYILHVALFNDTDWKKALHL